MADKRYILVCGEASGDTDQRDDLFDRLTREVHERGIENDVQLVKTGYFGFDEDGLVVKVLPDEVLYVGVKPQDAEAIVTSHLMEGRPVARLLYDRKRSQANVRLDNADFYHKQVRIVLRNCGVIDPDSIDEYIARDGYVALEKALFEMKPEDVIAELKVSGLRGRGGAGFPTWRKWSFCRQTASDKKYVICNADEGDPGAYMDRSTLEGDPHSVLEAMAIAGYTIGADTGVIYIRAEYPVAIKRLETAIAQAKEYGLLGREILGTAFSFDVEMRLGAGAFVCGEETALIASVEGKRGMPTPRPPFPSVKGLWGKPTVINNVETLANIPVIIAKGGEWFARIGTETSKGTKVFALTGKVNNTGLIEVPMGTTLRDIVFGIGGGIRNGKAFKAVQTGGPSGGMIANEFIDTPIDYESLQSLGSIMGSGGMIVMDEDDCMLDIARFYMEFIVDESCGKCAPCRIGGRTLFNLLAKIAAGNGVKEDVQLARDICHAMQKASLCGLGQTASNPVLSVLRHFEEEFMAHIDEKRCPAGRCRDLVTYAINPRKCIGCTLCARKCPVHCIAGEKQKPHVIDQSLCIKCGQCYGACKFGAVTRR